MQHQLGAALGMDHTTTMTLLAGLERRGLVIRGRDEKDRRAHRVTLTADLTADDRARATRLLQMLARPPS